MDDKKLTLPFGKGVTEVARHPCGLFALAKPEGILSHPNKSGDIPRALLRAPYDLDGECYELESGEDGVRRIWLLNRLDSATSGVLLCATDPQVAAAVRNEFAEGRVIKKYRALVFGVLRPAKQVWCDRLKVSRREGRLRTGAGEGFRAETAVRLIRVFEWRIPVSLIELQPVTGRTHQLRVQCAERKLPIVGDQTYGQFAWNREFSKATGRKRLFLHSMEVRMQVSVSDGERIHFSARAPMPDSFNP